MDSGTTFKPKVTVKLNYDKPSTSAGPHTRIQITRPVSPAKSYVSSTNTEPTFRPKAKVNSSATTRKAGGSTVSTSASTTPRAGSPSKLTPRIKTVLSPTNGVKNGSLRSPTATSAPATPELRRTVKTPSTSSLRTEETRTRTMSTSLRHAPSMVSFRPSASSVVSGIGSTVSGVGSASVSPRLLSTNSAVGTGERSSSPTPRIRSKVSNLVKSATESSPRPPSPSSPPSQNIFPSTRLTTALRTRTPSVSSSVNQIHQQHPPASNSPPQQFYPITTAVSAANPHRFAANRPPTAPRINSSPGHHVFQSFSQPSSTPLLEQSASPSNRPRSAGGLLNGMSPSAKIDPASIPLPPHSPPASAVSFSSRSSASRSSANASHLGTGGDTRLSSSTDSGSRQSPSSHYQGSSDGLRATLDNLMQYTAGANSATDDDDSGLDRDTDGEDEAKGKDNKVKAEAKSNRKIADLEITNRSLLVINASLEATKHRQAKEIHELKKKLRESRLILPPRAYRALSSQDTTELEDDDEDDDFEGSDVEDTAGDEIYKRVKLILDTLLASGKAALETQSKDFPEAGKGAAKVLSPQEQRDYHGEDEVDQDEQESSTNTPPPERNPLEKGVDSRHPLQQRLRHEIGSADIPNGSEDGNHRNKDEDYDNFNYGDNDSFDGLGNETITSEEEVEAMTISTLSPPSSPPPPILITQPT